MIRFDRWICAGLLACLCVWPLWAQQGDAQDILRRTADAFRRAGGVCASFSARSSEGVSSGVIRLKGEKFVLEADGMTTWFDGRTQWTYLSSSDEVNIAEPTPEELQGINPYAWLALYEHGYALELLPSEAPATWRVGMKNPSPDAQIERLEVWIDKATWHPVRISLTAAGYVEPVVITVRDYRTGQAYADDLFRFDPEAYPTAEVIDLR